MSNDTGTADVLAILTRIVARLEAIEKALEIGKEPPAPQPEPQAPIDGFDWKSVFASDEYDSVPSSTLAPVHEYPCQARRQISSRS
jgi:hypothetical protein